MCSELVICIHTRIRDSTAQSSLTRQPETDQSLKPVGMPGNEVCTHNALRMDFTRRAGVLFDVGHGQGSFNWTVAEIAAAEGFFPDVIS